MVLSYLPCYPILSSRTFPLVCWPAVSIGLPTSEFFFFFFYKWILVLKLFHLWYTPCIGFSALIYVTFCHSCLNHKCHLLSKVFPDHPIKFLNFSKIIPSYNTVVLFSWYLPLSKKIYQFPLTPHCNNFHESKNLLCLLHHSVPYQEEDLTYLY